MTAEYIRNTSVEFPSINQLMENVFQMSDFVSNVNGKLNCRIRVSLSIRHICRHAYTGCIKKYVPSTKSLQIRYLQNYGYQQQPMANIGHRSRVHLSQFYFHMFNFVSGWRVQNS